MSEAMLRFGDYEATPENASLFMFIGTTAVEGAEIENFLLNHVFIVEEKGDETLKGAYAFLHELDTELQADILNYMVDNGYTVHLNLQEVPDCDMQAWRRYVDDTVRDEEIEDFIPDDWDE